MNSVSKRLPTHRARTMKFFLFRVSLLFSIIGFLLIFSAGYYANKESITDTAYRTSSELASSIATSIYQLHEKGFNDSEIYELLGAHNHTSRDYKVNIYFDKQSALTNQNAHIQNLIAESAESASAESEVNQAQLSYVYPVTYKHDCVDCGADAFIVVIYDLSNLYHLSQNKLLSFLVYLSPIPILLSILVISYIRRQIDKSITELELSIDQVNKVSDLKDFSVAQHPSNFEEIERIYEKVEHLSTKLHDLAVDKDLLEFEIQLLERFVITSEVVRDWHEHVGSLLREINAIMPVYNLFSVFKVGDDLLQIEVFWFAKPTSNTEQSFNEKIKSLLKETSVFDNHVECEIKHHVADKASPEIDIPEEEVGLQTKSLVLEQAQIGGIVGIGINPVSIDDSTKLLVANSILSTLLNVVGSIKAIDKYTHDLEYYATRDPLTNLHNQRIFWEMLEYEVDRANRHNYKFAVLVIDLDNFKSLNDGFGHSYGDTVLQILAKSIKEQLRTGDFIARYGGDEFTVILPDSDLEQAKITSDRILNGVRHAELLTPSNEQIDVDMSIGIAIYPDHADTMRDVFMFADNMMYKAKAAGKGQVFLPTEEDIIDVFKDINDKSVMISQAVKERKVVPYFQPLMQLNSGDVSAVEVLCRIEMANGKVMPAHEFIEIAEKLGIIHQLDLVMLEKAIKQAEKENYKGALFINISPRSLILSEFIPGIIKIVNQFNIARERIVFEITERDTVKNMTLLKQFVEGLRVEGFKLAVDDFGSGFSSFHYLKHFEIDYVKIEGEFIANILKDEKDFAVVKSIANLAKELKAETIAEFVESEAILDSIKSIGITYGQGYHIRKPMPFILNED